MKRIFFALAFCCLAQGFVRAQQSVPRPRLVVGIVIDQMRWDYLYRYYDRYAPTGGFKRFLNGGFSCDNTMIPYTPTYTACGHSCIYTGSVPAINGITGNTWWDRLQKRSVYCTEDKTVNTVGSNSALGKMSPKNLLTTTVCDELKQATNNRSKVIGIAIKDRGGILPAGHSANAAYWYDNTVGTWITSDYYMTALPKWVTDFNDQKLVDKYYNQGWDLLYPAASYTQSSADEKSYEAKALGSNKFPYDLKQYAGKDYGKIASTPMGNTLTAEFVKAAITGEELGADNITDFLAVSFSSTDYIGHSYGPNSIEIEDCYLRLDKDLGNLFSFLDSKVGAGQYTVFLSADHGVLQVPEYLKENKLPGGRMFMGTVTNTMNKLLSEKYKLPAIISSDENYQITLNHHILDSANVDEDDVSRWIIKYLYKDSAVSGVFALKDLNEVPLPSTLRKMFNNSYYRNRSGDIQIILKPDYIDALSNAGTTHGLWNPYDSHIPLLWYGWGIKKGKSNHEVYMTDIAPTISALLKIQMPSGSIGQVIEEVLK
ncbi:MAG: alkaline phosphatase PafA [Chitinophagaceae bacterium]